MMRYDLLVLNSGASVGAIRERLESLEASAKPITLIRRQDIGSATWHRVGFYQLLEAIDSADADEVLSALVRLDAVNEVPLVSAPQMLASEAPYGVLMLGTEVIGFSEGPIYPVGAAGSKRGATRSAQAPTAPPKRGPKASVTRSAGAAVEAAAAPPDDSPDGHFAAYPVIDAPITVEPDTIFEVLVGVDEEAVRHTVATGILVTELDPYIQTVRLRVMVNSPGFEIVDEASRLPELKIEKSTLAHTPAVIRLRSTEPPSTYDPSVGVWTARITATFFYEGAIVGSGYREIRVNQGRARHAARQSDRTEVVAASSVPPLTDDTDITIAIEHEDGTGNFAVRVSSQHLDQPVATGRMSLGQDAKAFAATLVREVESSYASPVADETVAFFGSVIAEKMPDQILDALNAVWVAVNGPDVDEADRRIPDVLLLTDEWAVPWELMQVSFDTGKPAYLGAQVNVGRWPYQDRAKLEPGPLQVEGLGVMVGHYQAADRVMPLKRAEEEGRQLAKQYQATMVNADPESLDQLLAGEFADGTRFEALHFAGHGKSDPDNGTYLMYSDGKRMSVFALGAAKVAKNKSAFVFVNACQVGTADQMLGEYAGLAGTAIHAGFRGFVAPLWSVSDDIAKQISLGLYESSEKGTPISQYLREVRTNFEQTDEQVAHTTYMAYVFYGHPRLQLGGPKRKQPQ